MSRQDSSGGAEGGSAVHGEGSGAPAGSQGVTDVPLLVRVRVNRPGEPERWVVGAISKNDPAIAAALAEARAKARAPFLALAERMGAEGDPAIRYYANRIAEMVENAR